MGGYESTMWAGLTIKCGNVGSLGEGEGWAGWCGVGWGGGVGTMLCLRVQVTPLTSSEARSTDVAGTTC